MKLSIGLIVKNESKYLAMCLEALQPILKNIESEIIIVDTGSTDDTVEIAKKYTDKVFFCQWNNDFAEARNITIENARGEWYFYIDADEILENSESIINFFNKGIYKNYEALAVKIENLEKEDRSKIGLTFHSKRMVKKDKALRFSGRIHEYLPNKVPAYGSDAVLIHYGYITTDQGFVEEKAKRNIKILEEELKNDPDSIHLLYHIGQTYNFDQNYIEALKPARKALELAREAKIFPLQVYNLLLDICIKNQLYFEAEQTAQEVLDANQKETSAYINLYFYLAQAQAMLKKNKEAIVSYNKCLNLLRRYEKDKLPIDLSTFVVEFDGELYVYSQISALYDALLDYENSIYYSKKVLELTSEGKNATEQEYYHIAVSQIIKLNIKYKRYDNLVAFYIEIIQEKDEKKACMTNQFENTLESVIYNSKKHNVEVIARFAKLELETDYVFLNKIRKKKEINQPLSEEEVNKIITYNFYDKIDIYGELLFYLMAEGFRIDAAMTRLEEKEINRYIGYMVHTFDDFSEVVVNYFKMYDDVKDIYYSIFSKALKRVVLIKEDIDNEDYLVLFKRYVIEGVFYLENVYKDEILEIESVHVLKSHEEVFFMYMRKALLCKERDQSQYVQYMRKALLAYDYMKKGIELLLEELKNEETKKEQNEEFAKNEFEEYKMLVKNNIMVLIEENKLAAAKHLIDEYLKIVPADLEMLALKSEVTAYN